MMNQAPPFKFRNINPQEDLSLLDRGYPSLPLMFELHQRGINYCMRVSDKLVVEVRNILKKGQKDKPVTFKLPPGDKNLLTTPPLIL